jgi:enamine deaminase RidA (YjgF/YER057c/UK114 family)
MLKREIINPWSWQENLGFVHGHKVTNPSAILFLAGQTASDENGRCLFIDDMKGQIDQVLRNIGLVLQQGGMDFTNVVRLNIYTTDIGKLMAGHDHMVERLRALGCRHTGTLLGVSGLASPGAMIEMEVTAAG